MDFFVVTGKLLAGLLGVSLEIFFLTLIVRDTAGSHRLFRIDEPVFTAQMADENASSGSSAARR